MSSPNTPQRKGGNDTKSSGTSFFLYMALGTLGIVLLASLLVNQAKHKVKYPHFVALVRATPKLAEGATRPPGYGVIVVTDERDGKVHRYQYSNLREVVVGEWTVEFKADVADLDASTAKLRKSRTVSCYANRSPDKFDTQQLTELLLASNVDWDKESKPSAWRAYMPVIIFSGILFLFFFIMLRRMGGAGSPMQFGRSRGKLYAQEDLAVSFHDVAGIDEAVEEVREIVDFLKSPEKYQRLGGRIPHGVLLVGPPGTGKTLLAKAIAGEAGVPFFGMSGSDFVEMFVGVGAARVRDMFQQAESKAPCIIFIDELDALGKSRGSGIVGGHDEREQTLNALLVEMDGFDSNRGVIVMAATNRPEILDSALLRPGRFDRQVLVDRPDIAGREAILKVHVKHVKLDECVDLHQVAAITPGFAGADLANLVNEAALLAARREKNLVGMSEFNESVERLMAGLEKKQRVMNDDEKMRVAYHESGHALVAHSLPNTHPVHKVSIIPRGMAALGYTMQRPEGDRFLMTQSELESEIQVLLAGIITEEMIFSDVSTGAQNDLERATRIARRMVTEFGMSRLGRVHFGSRESNPFLASSIGEERNTLLSEETAREIDREVRRIIEENMGRAREILERRRAALEALAQKLLDVESVDAKELKQIVDENSPRPFVVPSPRTATEGADERSGATTGDETDENRSQSG